MSACRTKRVAEATSRDNANASASYCRAEVKIISDAVTYGRAIVCRADQFDEIVKRGHADARVDIESFIIWNIDNTTHEALLSHHHGGAAVYDRDGHRIFVAGE